MQVILRNKYSIEIQEFSLYTFVCLLLICMTTSCKKLVDAGPAKTKLTEANVYSSNATAISVLTGIYQQLSQGGLFTGNQNISLIAGLSSDEFTLSSAISSTDLKYYHYIDSLFSIPASSGSGLAAGTQYWSDCYNYIFECNSAIEGISNSNKLSLPVKQQLLGEARFLRAYIYFYLVNLYGDVPIITGTDWSKNSSLGRASQSEVYNQIISDLKAAQQSLSDKFLDGNLQLYIGTAQRVRPTNWAATALLARAYLFNKDWVNAEVQASVLINNSSLFTLPALNNVFLKNSAEAIWQLQPINSGQNTQDAIFFLLPSSGPDNKHPVYLSPQLLSAFEANDQRRLNRTWVDSVKVGTNVYYFPNKYKAGFDGVTSAVEDLKEYSMILRLGEQYLIRAEARAQQNNIGGAQADLNIIRTRAGLGSTPASTQAALLAAILHERQVELFSEWGHRWLDLKRTGNIDAVMTIVRPSKANGAPWKSYMQLYPIPNVDIQKNGNLTQNSGYQ